MSEGEKLNLDKNESLRTVVITGAGKRLGLKLTQFYLNLGWRVIAHFNSNNELEQKNSLTYHSIQANLDDKKAVEQLAEEILSLGWKVDLMIHNASCFFPDTKEDDSWQTLSKMMNVHVAAPQYLTMQLLPIFADKANVVAITDIYADLPNERFASYCASKSGLQNLMLSLAQRLAPKYRVNVIQPGPIQFLPEHQAEYREKVLSQSLLRKELGYQAIIDAVQYLAHAEAVTGSVMRVDGGRFVANKYEQSFI